MDLKTDMKQNETVEIKENIIKLNDILLDHVSGGSTAGKNDAGNNSLIFGKR